MLGRGYRSLTAIVVAVACCGGPGCGPNTDADDADGGSNGDETEALADGGSNGDETEALIRAICEHAERCRDTGTDPWATVEDCLELYPRPHQPLVIKTPAMTRACADALNADTNCDYQQPGDVYTQGAAPRACLEMLAGSSRAGDVCQAADTCDADSICGLPYDARCYTCRALATEGQDCSGSYDCAAGLVCGDTDQCVPAGLKALGESCSLNAECASWRCYDEVCVALGRENDPCDLAFSDELCAYPLFCGESQTCERSSGAIGDRCRIRGDTCASGLACMSRYIYGEHGTYCDTLRGIGERCEEDDQCQPGAYCWMNYECEAYRAEGESCVKEGEDVACLPGLHCPDGTCEPLWGNGEWCFDHELCASNYCEAQDNGTGICRDVSACTP